MSRNRYVVTPGGAVEVTLDNAAGRLHTELPAGPTRPVGRSSVGDIPRAAPGLVASRTGRLTSRRRSRCVFFANIRLAQGVSLW